MQLFYASVISLEVLIKNGLFFLLMFNVPYWIDKAQGFAVRTVILCMSIYFVC